MDTKRIDEYHKHGCNFYGVLVVVDYQKEYLETPKKFGDGAIYDFVARAKKLIDDKGYKVKRVLLTIPEYVVEIL